MDQRFGPRLAMVLVTLFGCSLRELDDYRGTGGAAATGGAGASGATGPGGAGASGGGGGGECVGLDLCNPPIEVYEVEDPGAGGGATTAQQDFDDFYDPARTVLFGEDPNDQCRIGWSEDGSKTMVGCRAGDGAQLYVQADGTVYRVTMGNNGAEVGVCPGQTIASGCQGSGDAIEVAYYRESSMVPVRYVFVRIYTVSGIATKLALERNMVSFPTDFMPGMDLAGTMAELTQVDGPVPNCHCIGGQTDPQ